MNLAGHRRLRRSPRRRERGILLVALLVAMAVMMILLTASAQSWSAIMRRDMENELIFRGNQYVQALRVYQQEHGGTFPTKLDDLMEEGPRGHRYLRRLFPDPFHEEGKWNLLFLAPDGKSALNPNSAYGVAGVGGIPGLPGGTDALGGGSSALPGTGSAIPSTAGATTGSLGLSSRPSRFESGNLNSPIVGVVSHGSDKAFNEFVPYFEGRFHYNEWEFHVFLQDVPAVTGVAGQTNINPNSLIGAGQQIYTGPSDSAAEEGQNVQSPLGGSSN